MNAVDRVGSPKKTENSRSELEITKITLELTGDLRSIACRSGYVVHGSATIWWKEDFPWSDRSFQTNFKFAVSLIALRAMRAAPLTRCEFSALSFKFSLCAVPKAFTGEAVPQVPEVESSLNLLHTHTLLPPRIWSPFSQSVKWTVSSEVLRCGICGNPTFMTSRMGLKKKDVECFFLRKIRFSRL
jgi:hypothetical protein